MRVRARVRVHPSGQCRPAISGSGIARVHCLSRLAPLTNNQSSINQSSIINQSSTITQTWVRFLLAASEQAVVAVAVVTKQNGVLAEANSAERALVHAALHFSS